ncbi:MAG: hypothetical protein KAQ83_02020 [Nanoarchaeota archaeon]|nr:hypothetical protein [Nanoarchaeota archaeon]
MVKKVKKVNKPTKKKQVCACPTDLFKKHSEDPHCGFFGRTLFIVGVLLLLNHIGILAGVSIWIKLLIGIGFALMKF